MEGNRNNGSPFNNGIKRVNILGIKTPLIPNRVREEDEVSSIHVGSHSAPVTPVTSASIREETLINDNFVLQTPRDTTVGSETNEPVLPVRGNNRIPFSSKIESSITEGNGDKRPEPIFDPVPRGGNKNNRSVRDAGPTMNNLNSRSGDPVPTTVKPKLPSTVDAGRAISKIANKIDAFLQEEGAFEMFRGGLRRQDTSEELFYKIANNAIYRSLIDFLGIVDQEKGKNVIIPTVTEETEYLDTWYFFDRIYHDMRVSRNQDPYEIISAYREIYGGDDCGIDPAWIPVLTAKLSEKIGLNEVSCNKLANLIGEVWCASVRLTKPDESELPDESDGRLDILFGNNPDTLGESEADNDDDPDDDDDDEDDDEEGEGVLTVCVESERGVKRDIITITDSEGRSVQFYEDLRDIDPDQHSADDVNGNWNWLRHFVPNTLIETDEPEYYLGYNELLDQARFIVVGDNEGNGKVIVALYQIEDALIEGNEDDDYFLRQLDMLCHLNLDGTAMSQAERNLELAGLFAPEAGVREILENIPRDDDDDEDDDEPGESQEPPEPETEETELSTEVEESTTGEVTGSVVPGSTEDEVVDPVEIVDFAAIASVVSQEYASNDGVDESGTDTHSGPQGTDDLGFFKPIRKDKNKR